MRAEPTVFQIEVEKSINDMLEHLGTHIAERRVAGVVETYITGNIAGRDVTFWIYPDGAAFLASRRYHAFDRMDYAALLELFADFLEELTRAVQGRGAGPGAKGNRLPASRN